MNPNKVITIYLDTSDFSRFADVRRGNGDEKYRVILENLLQMKEEGLVEFRYSLIHILEMLKSDFKYKDSNVGRGYIIEELCGDKVIKDIVALWQGEIINSIKSRIHKKDHDFNPAASYSNSGDWYLKGMAPDLDFDFSSRAVEAIKNHPDLTRKQRHLCVKQIKTKGTKVIFEFVLRANAIKDPAFNKVAQRFINDEIKEKEIECQWIKEIFSPANFFGEYSQIDSYGQKSSKILINFGQSLNEAIQNLRDVLQAIGCEQNKQAIKNGLRIGMKKIFEKPVCFIKTALESDENFEEKLNKSGIERSQYEAFYNNPDLKNLPSINSFYLYSRSYINHHSLGNRMPKVSDAGDIFHFLYAPYVDIFRADKFTSSLVKEYEKTFNTIIVDKLENLLPAIEKLKNIKENPVPSMISS